MKEKMKTLGIQSKLKMQHDRYKNNDIVLVLKKAYKIDNEIIDLQYSKYLGFQNVFIPLKGYSKLYNTLKERNLKQIIELNNFSIHKVVDGELQYIKEV